MSSNSRMLFPLLFALYYFPPATSISGSVGSSVRVRRAAAYTDRSFYWPNGTVPYVFFPSFLEEGAKWYRDRVRHAMWHIEFNTCIRFVELEIGTGDHAVLYNSPDSCSSKIGRIGGSQVVSVGRGCSSIGNVIHEILHTLGLWHTIARLDREKYVTVNWDNVDLRFFRNFLRQRKNYVSWFEEPYDFRSIMHYGTHQFSRNGLPTIEIVRGTVGETQIGQRIGLSEGDKRLLRLMYPCPDEESCSVKGYCVKGSCDSYGECTCHGGWKGEHCNRMICDSDCQELGMECRSGECKPRAVEIGYYARVPCFPGLDCEEWTTRNASTDWALSPSPEGLVLKTTESFKGLSSFSASLKTLTVLRSWPMEETGENCTVNLTYSTSGMWWLHSVELVVRMGDLRSTLWSRSLRETRSKQTTRKYRSLRHRRSSGRSATRREQETMGRRIPVRSGIRTGRVRGRPSNRQRTERGLASKTVSVDIGAMVEFSLALVVNLYEARGDFVVSELEMVDCDL